MKFELTKKQVKKFEKWKKSIKGAFGEYGEFTFSFRHTEIGEVITVENNLIGPNYHLDLTEVENW